MWSTSVVAHAMARRRRFFEGMHEPALDGEELGDVGVFGEVTDSEHELRRRILPVGRAVGTLLYT